MVIDEADHHFARRSSSSSANYADGFRKAWFARFTLRVARQLFESLGLAHG
jgi:hypothetical protein